MSKKSKTPITKKKNASGELNGFRFGVASMQGWRQTMEDAHRVSLSLPGGMKDCTFAGVFDGHGGEKTSLYASKNLLQRILRNISGYKAKENTQNSNVLGNQQVIKTAIIEGFLKLDDTMRKSKKIDDNSGTTAVCVFATRTHFYFANCGDSRAILCREDKICFSTKDHKPEKKAEKMRITAAGGDVRRNRVNGRLALSRALGDFEFKSNSNKGQCDQMVSPQPEITVIERNHETDQFIVLACDGVFDVMSNHELVRFIRNQMVKSSNIKTICNNVVDRCLQKGSRDNISIVILTLPGCPKQEDMCRKRKQDLIQMNHAIRSKKARTQKHPSAKSDEDVNALFVSLQSNNPSSQVVVTANSSTVTQSKNDENTNLAQTVKNSIQPTSKVKRPGIRNSFIIYFLDYWKRNGGNICKAAKACGESWGTLRDTVKQPYRRRYLAARRRNLNRMKVVSPPNLATSSNLEKLDHSFSF